MPSKSSRKPASLNPRSDAPTSPKSSSRRSTRNAPSVTFHAVDDTPIESPGADDPHTIMSSPPRPRVRRAPKPIATPAQRLAGRELIEALGGPQATADVLRLSSNSKAHALADMLVSADHVDTSLPTKLARVGLSMTAFTEILLEIREARFVARLLTSADEVAESIIAKATDQITEHRACLASGRMLQELEDGSFVPTADECFECQGSGYILKSAEPEWVDRYLELVRFKKNAPMLALTKNVTNQNLNLYGDLTTGDGAPSIDTIVKRADEQKLILPPTQPALSDGSAQVPAMMGMPEDSTSDDEPIEAEVVSDAKS